MNTNFHITKNFWEYAVHSRSYKAMSNTLRLCAKCLIFMRISLLYRISLFAGLSVPWVLHCVYCLSITAVAYVENFRQNDYFALQADEKIYRWKLQLL